MQGLLCCTLGALLLSGKLSAQECLYPNDLRRTIIAFEPMLSGGDVRVSRIHRYIEFPLNHLGYRVEYFGPEDMKTGRGIPESTAAILSWLDYPDELSEEFTAWRLKAQTPCGYTPRQIVFGHEGALPSSGELSSAILARTGTRRAGPEVAAGRNTVIRNLEPGFMNFETDFLAGLGTYPNFTATEGARSLLSVAPRLGAIATDLAIVGEHGGFAATDAILADDPRLETKLWLLNPFAFFDAVLGADVFPIGDTTTLNGQRLYFSTIEPDGWIDTEPSRFFGQDVRIGGELLYTSLIEPFPQLPTTVSVLHGDFDVVLAGPMADRGRMSAERILSLPQVEAATSGHDLIKDWPRFQAAVSPNGIEASGRDMQGELVSQPVERLLSDLLSSDPDPSTEQGRKYIARPFDLDREIKASLKETQGLQPSESAVTFFWARGSRPIEAAIRAVTTEQALSFGGGWNQHFPMFRALAGLSPISARIGDQTLIYDALASDAAFTSNWTGDLAGAHLMKEMLAWTDAPRRLKPLQLAFSARSALHFPTRSALKNLLKQVQDGPFSPIHVSDYIRIAEGFETLRFEVVGDLSWKVHERGALQTIRFDDADKLSLDMASSTGTLGANRTNNSLYIALDPTAETPLVTLAKGAFGTPALLAPGAVAVLMSGLKVSNYVTNTCTTELTLESPTGGRLVMQARASETVDVNIAGQESRVIAEEDGTFTLNIDKGGIVPVSVATECEGG